MFLENSYAMKSITSIEKFKEGDSIQGFFLCFEKHIRHSRNGDLYIDLSLLTANKKSLAVSNKVPSRSKTTS